MRSQNRWTGIVVGVIIGVLFSAGVMLAGSLEPSAGPTQDGLQGKSSIYLPITVNSGGSSSAGVPRTGQTPTVPLNPAPTGSDGALQKGVAWPNPRFTDNANGTVTDNLTRLIWLKNANCTDMVGEINKSSGFLTWANALTWCNNLAGGQCGLIDGSAVGDWRLPNVKEMQSLLHYGFSNPALPNTGGSGQWTEDVPFTGVQSAYYWSSTTYASSTGYAWSVYLSYGNVSYGNKTATYYVWPVRGGQ